MTKAQKAFFEQIALEEEDVKRDFYSTYAYRLLDPEQKNPLERTIEFLNEDWELDPPATPAILKDWIEDEEAIIIAKISVKEEKRKHKACRFSERNGRLVIPTLQP